MGLQSIEIGGTTVYRNGSRGSHVGVGGPWPALDQEYLAIWGSWARRMEAARPGRRGARG